MAHLSTRTTDLQASPIREILSVIDRPGMVSFAGGLPAPGSFPRLAPGELPVDLLQYGCSEGDLPLRECIAEELNTLGFSITTDQVLILSGSQQGIDLTAKLFIDKGTNIAVEAPTYLAALQVFRFFGAHFQSYTPGNFSFSNKHSLLYTIPTFQNPTGYCYSLEERQQLADICDSQAITLFEDDPYRDLFYDNCIRTPVCTLVKKSSWIYQGSFSKTFAPGLRLGFMACSKDLLPQFVRLKQAADLHSCRLSQHLVLTLLKAPDRETRMADLRQRYLESRNRFDHCLHDHMQDLCSWSRPSGGLFFWLRLNHAIDTGNLLAQAIEQQVAFMPGSHFFTRHQETQYLRLNFSHADNDSMLQGIKTLASLIRQNL